MKIDLGLAAVIGSAIIGLSIVIGSSIIAGKPNFVKTGDFELIDSTTGDKFINTSVDGYVSTFARVSGPTNRRSKFDTID